MLGLDDETSSRCNVKDDFDFHTLHTELPRDSPLLHVELRYNILYKCSYSAKTFSVLREIWCGKLYNHEYYGLLYDKGNLHCCCCFCCCFEIRHIRFFNKNVQQVVKSFLF